MYGNNNQGNWGMPGAPQGFNQPGYGGYPPPNGPPQGYGGYPPNNGPQGYPPQNSWGPPQGPPPGQYNGGYPSPPPQGNGYPGSYSSQSNSGYPGSFGASSPPPGQYGGNGNSGYNAGYPGAGRQSNSAAYMPPSGPPPDHSNPYPPATYGPPPGPPPMHYGAPPSESYRPPPQQYQNQPINFNPTGPGPNDPFFKWSNCTGRRKALCIGINYRGTDAALRGCHNDAQNISRFLCERFNFKKDDIVLLLDKLDSLPVEMPTRANITRAISWLVKDAQPNDSLFFHYSGHGGQAEDLDGDESDGFDETILPLDFKKAGEMIDDELHDRLVKPLPPGCRLTAIFDSCHSGSALDLPYVYSTEGKIKEPNLLASAGQGAMAAVKSYMSGDLGGALASVTSFGRKAMNGNKVQEMNRQTKASPADVVMFSGCKDSQTSADTQEAGKATGAMSYALITALTKYPQLTYQQLLCVIRDELREKYSQKPQLSASHPIDTSVLFII